MHNLFLNHTMWKYQSKWKWLRSRHTGACNTHRHKRRRRDNAPLAPHQRAVMNPEELQNLSYHMITRHTQHRGYQQFREASPDMHGSWSVSFKPCVSQLVSVEIGHFRSDLSKAISCAKVLIQNTSSWSGNVGLKWYWWSLWWDILRSATIRRKFKGSHTESSERLYSGLNTDVPVLCMSNG